MRGQNESRLLSQHRGLSGSGIPLILRFRKKFYVAFICFSVWLQCVEKLEDGCVMLPVFVVLAPTRAVSVYKRNKQSLRAPEPSEGPRVYFLLFI